MVHPLSVLDNQEAMRTSRAQVFFSIASMFAMINSALVGSFVGLLLAAFTLPLRVCSSVEVVVFLRSVILHQRYQSGQWMRLERTLPVLNNLSRTDGHRPPSHQCWSTSLHIMGSSI